MIEVEHIRKVYRVPKTAPGLWGSIKGLWHREYTEVEAVKDISFVIQPGERVGFLGPNGAGKTTTLKMLAGLLHPSAGKCRVAGMIPQERSPQLLSKITLVMGQKQQLLWDLPPRETFALNRALYGVDPITYKKTVDDLVGLLNLGNVIDKPTRNLSLGERMKCELAAALIHRPEILFLDEPTIGLDVTMQVQVREFIRACNEQFGATVILTSHYMQDISALTSRVIIIDKGQLRFDGALDSLARKVAPERRIVVDGHSPDLSTLGFVREDQDQVLTVPADQANARLASLLHAAPMVAFKVEAPPLEEVISRVFQGESA